MAVPHNPQYARSGSSPEAGSAFEITGSDTCHIEAEVRAGETPCAILTFKGALTNRDARFLGRLLASLNRRPMEVVILDLSNINQIDSTPLAALLMFVKEREPMLHALSCALVTSGPPVLDKIKTLGLAPLFEIFESIQEAAYSLGIAPGLGGAEARDACKLNMRAKVKMVTSMPRTAIIYLAGYMQEMEAQYLSWLLRQVGRRGARRLIVELSGVSYANWPALSVLVKAARAWQQAYGDACVALVGASVSIIRTLKMLGIEKYFLTAPTVGKARETLSTSREQMCKIYKC